MNVKNDELSDPVESAKRSLHALNFINSEARKIYLFTNNNNNSTDDTQTI